MFNTQIYKALNTQSALLLFDQILKLGFDPEVLLEGLGSHARNLLICRDDKMLSLFDGSEESKQRVMAQAQLSSPSWAARVLALHFFARKGTQADVRLLEPLTTDATPAKGSRWPKDSTVGKVASQAIAGLRGRLAQGQSG